MYIEEKITILDEKFDSKENLIQKVRNILKNYENENLN